ncbi:hypothetical protein TrLO_g12216, partial [Triparma laevis f. longispina]
MGSMRRMTNNKQAVRGFKERPDKDPVTWAQIK